ncbi:hypothetical protein SUS17_1322 [Sphingomonas sp. S17]|nr:hypothetical protein SUS17_1322 [Sphingomonas sp. S17]
MSGHRVGSVPAPGMAPRNALERQPAPFDRAIAANGLYCIGRTGRLIATCGR